MHKGGCNCRFMHMVDYVYIAVADLGFGKWGFQMQFAQAKFLKATPTLQSTTPAFGQRQTASDQSVYLRVPNGHDH